MLTSEPVQVIARTVVIDPVSLASAGIDFPARPLASNEAVTYPMFPGEKPGARHLVAVEYVVDATGRVDMATFRVTNEGADPRLVAAVRSAVSQWHYTPAMRGQSAVRMRIVQRFEFVNNARP